MSSASPRPGLDQLADRASGLLGDHRRIVLGVAGAPGSGKSSLARRLVRRLDARGVPATGVPMDGFHLADAVLDDRHLLDRKGAPETFDGHGYLALLHRLLAETDHDVFAPGFERTLEQPLAGAVVVPPATRIVVTEGNYLLDATDPWPLARSLMAEVWFVDLDDDRRRARLVDRHVKHGRTREAAQAWVDAVDEPNARRVSERQAEADLVVRV